jgi:hypothetical protein
MTAADAKRIFTHSARVSVRRGFVGEAPVLQWARTH